MSESNIPADLEAADTMSHPGDAPATAKTATDRADWLALMDRIGEDAGYFERLGAHHWAFFVDESPTLIVSFEQIDDIRARPGQMPLGHDIARAHGWSHLCVISDGETWYRDPRVYGFFDRLVDDAFFEDFDKVVFLGSGMSGYAAAAFSVAAPGATVIAVTPRATMAPQVAGWDKRATKARRLDFSSRYGFAPDMIDGARRVYVIYDPDVPEDAMHAALFRGEHVTHLRAPRLEGRVEWAMNHMQLFQPLVEEAVADTLTAGSFARLWRARRTFGPYLRLLLNRAEEAGRTQHVKMICRSVTSRLQAPRFRKRLADILADEAVAEATAASDDTTA